MTVTTVPVGVMGTDCYIVREAEGAPALLIDPAAEPDKIRKALGTSPVEMIVLTHGHFDHVGEAVTFRETYRCPIACCAGTADYLNDYELWSAGGLVSPVRFKPFSPDRILRDGEMLSVGGMSFSVRVLSGHTTGDLVLSASGTLFVGDLLFYGSIGRTDFPGGDVEKIKMSLRVLLSYPDGTTVYPGHDGDTTVGRERLYNEFIHYYNL